MAIRIFRHYWQLPLAMLAMLDCLLFFVVPYGVARFAAVDAGVSVGSTLSGIVVAATYAAALFFSMVAVGLYHARQRSTVSGFLVRIGVGVAAGSIVFAALDYFVLPNDVVPRQTLVAMGLVAFSGAAIARVLVYQLIDDEVLKRRVLVFGAGRRAAAISGLRRRSDRQGFHVVGYVGAASDTSSAVPLDQQLTLDSPLLELCRQRQVEEIVVAMDDRRRNFPLDDFLQCRLQGIRITDIMNFLERETGKVYLDVMNPSWMIFSEGFNRSRFFSLLERFFDIVASLALVLVTWPIMLLTVLAIKIEDGPRASVLYRQQRVGQYGRVFELLKFRSMREDAEKEGKAIWASPDDERVTRVGRFIRAVRIDELPQAFNVLKGDMSFVGPRPERPEFVNQLNERIPYYKERHTVKPGITGWAQLCYPYGSSQQDAVEKLQYDLYYVKNHSPIFYLAVLLQTVEVVLWRKGAR